MLVIVEHFDHIQLAPVDDAVLVHGWDWNYSCNVEQRAVAVEAQKHSRVVAVVKFDFVLGMDKKKLLLEPRRLEQHRL